jgi:uncharacterized protein YjbI with pentapeptide repeats
LLVEISPAEILGFRDIFIKIDMSSETHNYPQLLRNGVDGVKRWNETRPQGTVDLSGIDLRNAQLFGVDFHQCNLDRSLFTKANLENANLSGASLRDACLGRVTASKIKLAGADLRRIHLVEAVLCGADLDGVDLRRANLARCDLRGSTLRGACMAHAYLGGADLRNADLSNADLRKTALADDDAGDVNAARLDGSILRGVKWPDKNSEYFFELAAAHGIERAVFESPGYLPEYIEDAFFTHASGGAAAFTSYPKFFQSVGRRIASLKRIIDETESPPQNIIDLTRELTVLLIRALKSAPCEMRQLDPFVFEELIAELLAQQGWNMTLTPRRGDGGYDILGVTPTSMGMHSSWIIECKLHRSEKNKVSVAIARALYGTAMDLCKLNANMMLATTTSYTRGAKAYAASKYNFELKDFEDIVEWVNVYRPHPGGALYIRDKRLVVPG